MDDIKAVIFDAYGTLLDVHSAMAAHADRLGPNWQAVSADWRAKQLEYSWVLSLAGTHQDFSAITSQSLAWAMARHGIADAGLIAELEAAYLALTAYPEVPGMLRRVRAMGIDRAILSNGSPAMLAAGVQAAGLDALLDDVLSVESVGIFKPDMRVYALATARFEVRPQELLFVSSNAWDAYGAGRFGCKVAWINRAGAPPEYGLAETAEIMRDLSGIPDLLA
jgi:2-haloacid dehalogenase